MNIVLDPNISLPFLEKVFLEYGFRLEQDSTGNLQLVHRGCYYPGCQEKVAEVDTGGRAWCRGHRP